MKTRILIDDDTVGGAAAVECDLSSIDEYLKITVKDVKIYLPLADIKAAYEYGVKHG